MKTCIKPVACLLFYFFTVAIVNAQQKIIDMHIHSYTAEHFRFVPKDPSGIAGAPNDTAHFKATYAAFKKYNIVKAVVSGTLQSLDNWVAKDTDKRIIRGIAIDSPDEDGMDSVKFEQLVKDGKIQVFGEVGAYYTGTTPADSAWQPYLRICEKYDIPVAVHTGGGPPGSSYTWAPKSRLWLGDPYLLEDVLVRYPKLRVYLMHAGENWHEHALRLMASYENLYVDVAVLLWVEPLTQRYATEFLQHAKQAGFLNRVMYGTDQMVWPHAIKKSIDFLNGLNFLTAKDKEDIFYNNAERFLKLP